jgi:hypothetical protein
MKPIELVNWMPILSKCRAPLGLGFHEWGQYSDLPELRS